MECLRVQSVVLWVSDLADHTPKSLFAAVFDQRREVLHRLFTLVNVVHVGSEIIYSRIDDGVLLL